MVPEKICVGVLPCELRRKGDKYQSDYGSEDGEKDESDNNDDQIEVDCDFCDESEVIMSVAEYETCDYCGKRSILDKTPVFRCESCTYEGCMACHKNKI